MKGAKGTRSANRSKEDIRDDLNRRKASHIMHVEQIDKRLAALDAPRQPRKKKDSYAKLSVDLKACGKTPEEIRMLLGL